MSLNTKKIYSLALTVLLIASSAVVFTRSTGHAAKRKPAPSRSTGAVAAGNKGDGLWVVLNVQTGRQGGGIKDFQDLFKGRGFNQWRDARNSTDVVVVYDYMLVNPDAQGIKKDSDLREFITMLNNSGTQIGVYSGLYGVDETNCGIKGAQAMWDAQLRKALERIKNNGGSVRYVLLDSPLAVGTSSACNQSPEQIAKEIGEYGRLIQTLFPQATLVDTDPYPSNGVDAWKEWLTLLKKKAGKYVEYISLDTNVGYASYYDDQWASTFPWNEVLEIEQYAHSLGFKVLSEEAATRLALLKPSKKYEPDNNQDVYWYTLDRAGEYYTSGGQPDAEILISWYKKPDRALPDYAGYSLMNLARDLVYLGRYYASGRLEIVPSELTIVPGQIVKPRVYFTINGPSGPLSTREITKYVTWRSDNTDFITVGNIFKEHGLVTGQQPSDEPITIRAQFAGYEASAIIHAVPPAE